LCLILGERDIGASRCTKFDKK